MKRDALIKMARLKGYDFDTIKNYYCLTNRVYGSLLLKICGVLIAFGNTHKTLTIIQGTIS